MSAIKWNENQLKAINARDKSLILSAAAGSGKTAVLVERIASLLLDKDNPVGADELIVVTYSNAAAAEMKQRLSQRLMEEKITNPNNKLLKRQITLLKQAKISTVHAFCNDLIKDNFFRLNLPSDIHIADEQEKNILFEDSLNKAIENNYNKNDSSFLEIVDMLSVGRDDRKLKDTIKKLYTFIRSYPFYINWLDERLNDFNHSQKSGETIWGKIILNYAKDIFNYSLSILEGAEKIAASDEAVKDKYSVIIFEEKNQLKALIKLAEALDWNGVYDSLSTISFNKLPIMSKKIEFDIQIKEAAQEQRNLAKKVLLDFVKKDIFCSEENFYIDNEYMKKLFNGIVSLIKDLDIQFANDKLEKRVMDFSDLEHFTLKLLVKEENGEFIPTDMAQSLSEKYKEVLVDEYQDTNAIQDLIFKSVSDNGKHLFMVGDVKQSIYGFRQAMPEIFLSKKKSYPSLDDNKSKAKIILANNYRSRKEITDGINFIFRLLMSEEVGGLNYGGEDELYAGAKYPEADDRGCELDLIELQNYDEEDLSSSEIEADYIAKRIKNMIDSGYEITDKSLTRKLKLSDVAILLRATKDKAVIYQEALKRVGLDSNFSDDRGFLSSIEIRSVMSLLKALDNPLLDVELFSAMMSPLFEFSAEELAEVSAKNTNKPLYVRLLEKCETNSKVKIFINDFQKLRIFASSSSTNDLIYKIYDLTEYETKVRMMQKGKIKSLNLKLLADYASDFDNNGYKGLNSFLHFIVKLEESGGDLAPANFKEKSDESVEIMSIHSSKGLEFPIVFLADCGKRFNKMDLMETTIINSKLGFAAYRTDNDLGVRYKTVHYSAVQIQSEKDLLSEEVRLLYVAMTRAKEKLIITAALNNIAGKIKRLNVPINTGKLPFGFVKSQNSYSDWIISAILHHHSSSVLLSYAGVINLGNIEDSGIFDVNIVDEYNIENNNENVIAMEKASPSATITNILINRKEFIYHYKEQTLTPTKLAISAIGKDEKFSYKFSKRPKFLFDVKMTAAEKGNTTHKFMQFAKYENLNNIEAEIKRLVDNEFLSKEEAENVDVKKVQKFTQSDLFKRMLCADKIYREYDFLAEVSGEEISEYTNSVKNDCFVTVQGIADCVIIEKEKATVIDYKTDFVKTLDELKEKYNIQLNLYKKLLSESLGCEISQAIIYSFHLGKEIVI